MRALRVKLAIGIAVLGAAGAATAAIADHGDDFEARLSGFQEVPVVITDGTGTFRARLAADKDELEWQLSYSDLNAPVQQAHIHIGQRLANGAISVFLCTNLGNAPMGTTVQACPDEGTISGTIDADDVTGPVAQGISPGEFGDLVRAMRAGVTYANVHTAQSPGGEIRGQIRGTRRHR